jgi:NADPH:quinone reductase-like Zn-dependent oxidoreductase
MADMERITGAILAGRITVPIAGTFRLEEIRDAVAMQSGRHVYGKIVVTLRLAGAVRPAGRTHDDAPTCTG